MPGPSGLPGSHHSYGLRTRPLKSMVPDDPYKDFDFSDDSDDTLWPS